MDNLIIQGHISSCQVFPDGNHSYTVRDDEDGDALYRFTEASPLSDKSSKPLLRGSIIQAELEPVVNDKNEPVVQTFERRDLTEGQVGVVRLKRWYLVEAAKSADEKAISQPLIRA